MRTLLTVLALSLLCFSGCAVVVGPVPHHHPYHHPRVIVIERRVAVEQPPAPPVGPAVPAPVTFFQARW
jgi:hypothetical protein